MVAHETVLPHGPKDITTSDMIAGFLCGRFEVPLLLAIQRGNVDSARNINTLGVIRDSFERSLNPIVDRLHQSRAKLDGQGFLGAFDRVSNRDTGSLLVDLDRGLVSIDTNNFSHEFDVTNANLELGISNDIAY